MSPPFSAEDFFRVFVEYNTAVWPAQVVLNVTAIAAVGLAFRNRDGAGRVITWMLAALWLWMGIAYHWVFFADINPVARGFGVVFVLQGAVFGWLAMRRSPPVFEPRRRRSSRSVYCCGRRAEYHGPPSSCPRCGRSSASAPSCPSACPRMRCYQLRGW